MTTINAHKEFLKKLEKNLFDLKKEILKRNNNIDEVNTLIWMIDNMRKSLSEEMLKTLQPTTWTKLLKTFPGVPETPWEEIYEKTEYIWTYCNRCAWRGYIKKSKRDDPCPVCSVFDLKQRYIIAKIHCNDCDYIEYAKQGVLKCDKCKSKNIRVIRQMEVSRTLYGTLDHKERAKDTWINPWPTEKKWGDNYMSDLITFKKREAMIYLDNAIVKWRERKIESKEWEDILIASCYIDAFQSVRMSLFGELLPKE